MRIKAAKWQESAPVLSLRHTVDLFWEQNIKRCPDPTVTLHYFHWPTTRPDAHTKIALRLQSSSHSGDTNGMIDTNVSRANCAADLHRSDRASYPSTHLACWQEPPWRVFFFLFLFSFPALMNGSLFVRARCLCPPYAVWMACRSIITY